MAPDSEPTPRVPWLPVSEGTEPAAPEEEEDFSSFPPVVPSWIQREAPAQEPQAEEEPPNPLPPPSAAEVLPDPGTAPAALEDPPARHAQPDAVQLLGESAVASAALSAAGAPTPLGGVPIAPVDSSVTPPDFGEPVSFVPAFDGEPTETEPEHTPSHVKADALAAGIVAQEQEQLASRPPLDGGAVYTPRAFSDGAAVSAPIDTQPEPPAAAPAQAEPPSGRKGSLLWLWILLAVVVLALVGIGYAVLNKPDPAVIPGVTVTEPAPSPTIVPSPAPTGSDFQAAMPATVGTYSLVGAEVLDPADVALTAGRVADGVDLTYRSGDDTMKVRALQYFNEDDAKAMFTQFAGEDAATEPVEAGGTTVGEKAIITSPKPGIVWRNGTSVFILTGPALQLTDFYEQFGL
ncbi:MAG: hypothetical protein NVV57_06345 [Demequina sp.]|jgi:hypothetical protein|nr:hypothetical protein [Demequina sp.]